MTGEPLKLYRGNDRRILAVATYPEDIPDEDITAGDPFPLSGKTVWFTVKRLYSDIDEDALFQKSTEDNGITIRADPDNNVAEITIDRADTEGIYQDSTFHYDLQTKNEDEKVWTIAEGTLTVEASVTRTG